MSGPGELSTFGEARQPASRYVFLSYAREDGGTVEKIRHCLKSNQWAYWDYREAKYSLLIPEIEEAISNAFAFVSILSDAWNDEKTKRWLSKEILFAEQFKVPVLVLKVSELRIVPLVVIEYRRIDLVQDFDEGLRIFLRELLRNR